MDDHDGTGIPGEDSAAAGETQPTGGRTPAAADRAPAAGQRRTGRKPPVNPGRNAAAKSTKATPAAPAGKAAQGQKADAAKTAKASPAAPAGKTAQGRHAAAAKAPTVPPAAPAKKAVQAQKTAQSAGVGKTAKVAETATVAKTAKTTKGAAPAKGAVSAKPAAPANGAATAKSGKPTASPKAAAAAGPSAPPAGDPWQVPGYVHEEDLGADTAGRVVRARHEADGTPVVITYLPPAPAENPAVRAAFRAEAEVLGAIDSPYVARLYGYVEDGPHAAVVREVVTGVGLESLLREKGPTAPEPALAVFKGSLLGLAAAHEAGVVHRDYRPANVLVTTEGAAKLVGFGEAAGGGDGSDGGGSSNGNSNEAGDGSAVDGEPGGETGAGTPASPAAATTPADAALEPPAGAPATAASDIHAATAAFYECLTGAAPYADATVAEPGAQDADAPVPYGQLPEPVRPLVARGLASDPAERPQSAADFAAELETVAAAAYGADWEERGRRELAAVVALVLEPPGGEEAADPTATPAPVANGQGAAVSSAAGGGGAPFGPGPTDGTGDDKPRFGRRAKILALAAVAVVAAGALAVTAVANGGDDDTAAVRPAPAPTTPLTTAPAPVTTTPVPSRSPSAEPTTATPAATPTASTPRATPTTHRPSAPARTPARTHSGPPATPSAAPTRTSGSGAVPHVFSLNVTRFECGGGRTATATVFLTYDGTAAGTLHLSWWRSATGRPQGAIPMAAQQTARFPKGATSYTFTDKFSFTPDRSHPYVGLTVSTDPAAASGNGTYGVGCR